MKVINIPVPDGRSVKRTLSWAAALLVGAYLVYAVRSILLPLGLAFLLAMVLDPVVDRMELRGWSRARASAFIFVAFLLIVGGLVVLAIPYCVDQVTTLQ